LQKISPNTSMVLGHTRQGTHGLNTKENTHPFRIGPIVGIHNGVIDNYWELAATVHESDSRTLFEYLANVPPEKLGDALEEVEGSFALAFAYDNVPYLVRNVSSPCWVAAMAKERGIFVFSSERRSLEIAMAFADLEPVGLRELTAGRLVKFPWKDKTKVTALALKSYQRYLPTKYSKKTSVSETELAQTALMLDEELNKDKPFNTTVEIPSLTRGMPSVTVSFYGSTPFYVQKEGDTLYTHPGPGAINCIVCKKTRREEQIHVVNGKCMCSVCWEDRITSEVKSQVSPWDDVMEHEMTKGT